jgi:hypothetical protein
MLGASGRTWRCWRKLGLGLTVIELGLRAIGFAKRAGVEFGDVSAIRVMGGCESADRTIDQGWPIQARRFRIAARSSPRQLDGAAIGQGGQTTANKPIASVIGVCACRGIGSCRRQVASPARLCGRRDGPLPRAARDRRAGEARQGWVIAGRRKRPDRTCATGASAARTTPGPISSTRPRDMIQTSKSMA